MATTSIKHKLVLEGELQQYLTDELAGVIDPPARHLNPLAGVFHVADKGFGVSRKKDPAAAGGAQSHRVFDVLTEDGTPGMTFTGPVIVDLSVPESGLQDILDLRAGTGHSCVLKKVEANSGGIRHYDLIFYKLA